MSLTALEVVLLTAALFAGEEVFASATGAGVGIEVGLAGWDCSALGDESSKLPSSKFSAKTEFVIENSIAIIIKI
jgi:hypothetical protein